MRIHSSVLVALLLALAPTVLPAEVEAAGRRAPAPKAAKGAKTGKKPAAPAPAPAPLAIVESVARPKVDYQAETYAGVPLEDPYARDRGLDKGLVRMVFEKQRRLAFRIPREKIKKRVRFAVPDAAAPVIIVALGAPRAPAAAASRERIDVVDTEDGVVVVVTTTSSSGIFTTSDVYAFPKGATPEQRVAMLVAAPPASRYRIREALQTASR